MTLKDKPSLVVDHLVSECYNVDYSQRVLLKDLENELWEVCKDTLRKDQIERCLSTILTYRCIPYTMEFDGNRRILSYPLKRNSENMKEIYKNS